LSKPETRGGEVGGAQEEEEGEEVGGREGEWFPVFVAPGNGGFRPCCGFSFPAIIIFFLFVCAIFLFLIAVLLASLCG
jgi:hypothetical protein